MLVIEDEILEGTQLSEAQFRVEIALALYEKELLSFGRACRLAQMDYVSFESLLFDRQIPNPYTIEDLHADLDTLNKVLDK